MNANLASSRPLIARVEPLTRTRAVRGPFDYRLRPEQADVGVGALLRVPFGRQTTLGVVLELATESALAPERLAEPDAVLPPGVPADLVELAAWIAEQYCSTPARALSLLLPPGAVGRLGAHLPKPILVAELTEAGGQALSGGERLTDRQRAVLTRLENGGPALATALGTATLRRLEGRGLVALRPLERASRPDAVAVGRRLDGPPALTADQQRALETVLAALAGAGSEREVKRFLLHGVTGSGKTEVYLQAVQATLAAGRGAIVLVPEIGLTPQTVGRFQARFGDIVAVLHSGLGQRERHEEWLRLRSGEARVCIGPRSAVFAPLHDIGLIVVDEEHDGSYKHEGDPRYDARAVAQRRAEQHRAVLLAGSATPRPESVVDLRRLRLPERIDSRPLPPVDVLDMRGLHHPLHPVTRMALADVRAAGSKAIVLLNRRGWSNFLSCRGCGHVWMCPNCEVALVMHRAQGTLACHHCGHRRRAPSRCQECGSTSVARHGAGTESIEQELHEAFGAELPVFRLDADATAGKGRLAQTLARFEAAPAGVLVGTQMVAKGHDFAEVALGVVLDADQTLRFPDFRAEERTFALLTQLAGRVGRGEDGGRVLVQTLAPDAQSIALAAHHDSDGFLAVELRRREALGYPPYGTLIRIVCASPDAGDALELATRLHGLIVGSGATVLGPAPLFKLRGRFRSQLVIKCRDRLPTLRSVGAAVDACAADAVRRGVSVSVDPDPQ
ncbi:MAG TPA: primosomal protein N' [Solirubrobacteraceae bacterium]|nr:primosomal protein N' [Solirubrobacteraceae bacterium]